MQLKILNMSLDPDGKLDGKTPVFNDVLAVMWNKMCRCPRDPLVKACVEFYQLNDIQGARDLFHRVVPERPGDKRRVRHRAGGDILCGIYAELQALPSDSEFIFVAKNLNNIPTIDLASIDGATLVHKQATMNQTLSELVSQHKEILKELSLIKGTLSTSRAPPSENSVTTEPNGSGMPVENGNTVGITAETGDHDNQTFTAMLHGQREQSTASGSHHAAPAVHTRRIANGRNTNENSRATNNPGSGANGVRIGRRNSFSSHQSLPRSDDQRDGNDSNRRQEEGEDDFQTWDRNRRRKGRQSNMATGRKTGSEFAAIPKVKKCAIFVSRLSPNITQVKLKEYVGQIIDDKNCAVEKLKTRFETYASFHVTCDDKYRAKLLDPEVWETGILVRPFYGVLPAANPTTEQD